MRRLWRQREKQEPDGDHHAGEERRAPECVGWMFRMMDTHDNASGEMPDRSGRALNCGERRAGGRKEKRIRPPADAIACLVRDLVDEVRTGRTRLLAVANVAGCPISTPPEVEEVRTAGPSALLVPPDSAGFRAKVGDVEAASVRIPQRLRHIPLVFLTTPTRACIVGVFGGVLELSYKRTNGGRLAEQVPGPWQLLQTV
jgi:hypothetical protein